MSAKSERKRRIYEAKKNLVPTPPAYTQPPVEKLPKFNTDQLTSEAIEREPSATFLVCQHLEESRNDVNSDFFGYLEKIVVEDEGERVVAFVKQCAACSEKTKDMPHLVARVEYECLSEYTMKAMLKNQGEYRMEPVSERAKKLAAEAEAEGPSTIN